MPANALFFMAMKAAFVYRLSCRTCGSRRAKQWACRSKPIRAASVCWAFCSVLGFLSRKSHLHFFEARETMTAQFVIESIEALLPQLSGPTVVVLDNASVHRSKLVQAKRK